MNYGREAVEEVMAELGIEPVGFSDDWARSTCPAHDDTTPSFAIHIEEGGWKCRAGCGSNGDLAVLVDLITGEGVPEARERIKRMTPYDTESMLRLLDRVEEKSAFEIQEAKNVDLSYEEGKLHKYMFDRGFNEETMLRWRVGFDEEKQLVVIPLYFDGVLVALVRRAIWGKVYINSEGISNGKYLMGLDHIPPSTREVFLVEGPMDAMWMSQHGYPAVAAMGSSISDSQLDILRRRFYKVTTLFDNDKAGQHASLYVFDALSAYMSVRVLLPPKGRDVQNLTGKQIRNLLTRPSLKI